MRFSSDWVAVDERKDAVEAAFGAHVRGQIDFARDTPVRVEMALRTFESIHLAQIAASPLTLVTPSADDGLLYLSVTRSGGGVVDARGAARRVEAGDVTIMYRDRRCTTVVDRPSTMLSLALPRALLDARVTRLDDLRDRPPGASPGARLLARYAAALADEADLLDAPGQALVAGHLADLVVLALEPGADAASAATAGGVRAARRRAVKADIAAHLTDPRLDLAWLARRHRVSAATVRALFYDEGTSFSDYVKNARLDHVHALLRSPFARQRTIATLALSAGFNDISWFNQAFRRRFGMTPSDVRAEARVPA